MIEEGRRRRPHLFRLVLSHSRKGSSEAVWRQTEHTHFGFRIRASHSLPDCSDFLCGQAHGRNTSGGAESVPGDRDHGSKLESSESPTSDVGRGWPPRVRGGPTCLSKVAHHSPVNPGGSSG